MTQSTTPALVLGNIAIRQHAGLFSLNDLHQAAGGEERHRPNQFIRNDQTQALVAELKAENLSAVETVLGKGKAQGTYASRELVIAYAAWISAAFHLKVIRVFLAAAAPQRPANPALDYDRISPAQAQDLKELVHAIVDAKVQGFAETWARLHRKFRVNSYLELPAAHFQDARDYLLGKLPDEPAPEPTLRGRRWLIATDTQGRETVQPIGHDDFVTTWPRLVADVESGECLRTSAELLAMASACTRRVQQRTLRN